MGYNRHHAIIVTISDEVEVVEAHDKATEIFGHSAMVSPVVMSKANSHYSFFVGPDGSKDGWESSNQGDQDRKAFIAYIRSRRCTDGSGWSYVEVQFGDDNGETKIMNSSDDDYNHHQEELSEKRTGN